MTPSIAISPLPLNNASIVKDQCLMILRLPRCTSTIPSSKQMFRRATGIVMQERESCLVSRLQQTTAHWVGVLACSGVHVVQPPSYHHARVHQ